MAAETDGIEEQNSAAEQIITEKVNINEEKNVSSEFKDEGNYYFSEPDPPDESTISQDESTKRELNWPMQERCVHGEINDIWVPLDKSEVYSRIAEHYELPNELTYELPYEMPYEVPSFSDYYYREWSEVEHLFMPAIEFAEELYGGHWTLCPPSPTRMGL